MKIRVKKFTKPIISAVLACMLILLCVQPAFAYFDRGTVGVSVGTSQVSVYEGASESVTVTLSPASDSQLPGCGMAECPQICGEQDCLDENGECTCNGRTPQTYYADVEVTSSNTSVATASYINGILTVYGVSAGSATITITGSLRQYQSSSATINVDVAEQQTQTTGENVTTKQSSTETTKSSSEDVRIDKVTKESKENTTEQTNGKTKEKTTEKTSPKATTEETTTSEKSTKEKETEKSNEIDLKNLPDGVTYVDSKKGIILFVPIESGKMGKKWLSYAKENDATVDFQMKDSADNVIYAWEFKGEDIKKAANIDLNMSFGTKAFDGCKYGSKNDSVYLAFAHSGKLPGKASVYLDVADYFSDGDELNLYQYLDDGSLELIKEEVTFESGFVKMDITHCSNYILTTQTFKADKAETTSESTTENDEEVSEAETQAGSDTEGNSSAVIYIVIAVVIVVAVIAVIVLLKRKKDNQLNTEGKESEEDKEHLSSDGDEKNDQC